MRVFFLRRNAFPLMIAFSIFVCGNLIMFYKFMSRKTTQPTHAKDSAFPKTSYKFEPSATKVPLSHASFDKVEKQQNSKEENEETPKEEDFVTMDMKKNDLEDRQKDLDLAPDHEPNTEKIKKNVKTEAQNIDKSPSEYTFAILVIACNRPTVTRCLDKLIKYRPSVEKFPIVVSQDCGHEETAKAIRSYGDQLAHIQQPELGTVPGVPPNMRHFMGYYKISRHYKWALGQMFDVFQYDTVIIVEDDLDIAPDFFEYFVATRPLLENDPTLWCVSAWNDNGKEGMVQGNDLLYRTDFFSGLGWMLTKDVWNELRSKWPLGFWDDWMRESNQRKERACIRPEICRTRTFGKIGVSKGQFFEQHLKYIKLNEDVYPFTKADLSYLVKENYDEQFRTKVVKLPTVTAQSVASSGLKEAKMLYSSDKEFEVLAKSLGAMYDFKAGIPRVSYQGVVVVIFKGCRVYLTPRNFLTHNV